MSEQYSALSEDELTNVIENAKRALQEKMDVKRKDVIQQIMELASSIKVSVEIHENSFSQEVAYPKRSYQKSSLRKGSKVAPKYQNPNNNAQTWSGRGMKPKWLSSLLEMGRSMDEFEIRN
ncbi:MAG: H-NS family nucleoid-associated regulatory protein [Methylococcaceae bacterium]